MADDTLIQFGGAVLDTAPAVVQSALCCPTCHQHFSSGDARFCPFDGEPLVESSDYDPSADPLLGSVVDQRYQVERVLGEGGMGCVFHVRHVALGKAFAMKVLRADLATDEDIAERFIGEARTAAAVSHHGLVEITDFGKLADGRPYFVMELLEGEPLSWLIRRAGALPPARVIGILTQVAESVSAAHRAGIVHRDIKPDNIQIAVGKEGVDHVKVLDFGLAKVMGGSRRTRNGVVFGTPHYMSPEQAAGEEVDHRADIYSLGIVMYEMLTGRVPFEADTYMGVLSKHIYMQPTPPSTLVPSSEEIGLLESVVLKCLEKKPRNRYQSFDELLVDLSHLFATGQLQAPQLGRRSAAPLPLARRSRGKSVNPGRGVPLTPLWPIAALLGLALLGVAGFLLVRSLAGPAPTEPASQVHAKVSAPAAVPLGAEPVLMPSAQTPESGPDVSPSARPSAVRRPPLARSTALAAPGSPPPPTGRFPTESTPPKPSVVRRTGGVRGEIVDPWAN